MAKQISSKAQVRKELSDKQKIFVEVYLRTLNATEAARQAGYAHPADSGYENLRKPEIRKLIAVRLSQEKVETSEVLARAVRQMRGSLSDFLNFDKLVAQQPVLDLDQARERGQLHLVKKIEYTDLGGIKKIELYSAENARRDLMQHLGLLESGDKQVLRELQAMLLQHKLTEAKKQEALLDFLRDKAPRDIYLAILKLLTGRTDDSSKAPASAGGNPGTSATG